MTDELKEKMEPSSPVSSDGRHGEKGCREGIGLCLSGGGFRAMLFHVGALWRLYDAGILGTVARVSGVSGGSIVTAFLGLQWDSLFAKPGPCAAPDFKTLIVDPLLAFVDRTQGPHSVWTGLMAMLRRPTQMLKAYDRLFQGKTLQDLAPTPRFVLNATNLKTGRLWRFSKPYMADWLIGQFQDPKVSLALAVAASAGFPPVLSPIKLTVDAATIKPGSSPPGAAIPSTVYLADGGVYDNFGLETVWKNYRTVLVSDGGAPFDSAGTFSNRRLLQLLRVENILTDQIRAVRVIQLIDSYKSKLKQGAYWGIATDIAGYGLSNALPFPRERALALSQIPTGLCTLPKQDQHDLVRWGYAVCDATLRKHYNPALAAPKGFPPL